MPNRLIRDGLLTSWRYERLSSDAKIFYFHLLLCADDLGCIDLGPTFLRRRVLFSQDSDERIAKLVSELADVDLLRPYDVSRQCLGFIPRFGQRVQIKYAKYKLPPESLYADDEDARAKFNRIIQLTSESTDGQRMDNGFTDDGHRTVSGKREAVSKHPSSVNTDKRQVQADTVGRFDELWSSYPRRNISDNKARAIRAYSARLRDGVTHEQMLDGVRRYARHCERSGKVGTEFVKMCSTFLGPDKHFSQSWDEATRQSTIPMERL